MTNTKDPGGRSTSARAVPSGAVTFVLGDVAGAGRRWENRSDELPAALARLDALVDAGLGEHGGDRSAEADGDDLVATFARAADAVAFAAGLQRALVGESWPGGGEVGLRIAVHTGDARGRDEGRSTREALRRCAHLRASAHPGQVLVSGSASAAIADTLPPGTFLRDLGLHHLRDLGQPERVAQVCGSGLPTDFPPLHSLDRALTNLPVQLTSFVGRAGELAQTGVLLADRRLLTLLGAGGCGKTRLAVQLAAEVADDFADGVWFADLAPLADPDLVARTLADAVGIAEVSGRPIQEVLTERLADAVALIVLDNCEHLLDGSAALVEALLRSCPGARVLVTSREPLGVPGEATYRVPSLGLPAGPADAACESVTLFAARAELARPTMRVGPTELAAMVAICLRVDGIPLAIELAAARCRALTPSQIADRLATRFGLLTGGTRGALPRHRALEASIGWSYDLLPTAEQTLLLRLSVFAGGFDLDAAEAVGAATPAEAWVVLDLLTALVDRSLVGQGEDGRYRLLEPIRQFAETRLLAAGEGATARRRHAEHFRGVAEAAEADLYGTAIVATRARLGLDLDNLRTAAEHAIACGDADLALGLVLPVDLFWQTWLSEASERLARILALPGLTVDRRLLGLAAAAEYGCLMGDLPALVEYTSRGLAVLGDTDDPLARGWMLELDGWMRFFRDEEGGEESGRAGVQLLRSVDKRRADYYVLDGLWGVGFAVLCEGRTAEALAVFDEALESARRGGGLVGRGRSGMFAATVPVLGGDITGRRHLLEESERLLEECGDLFVRWGGVVRALAEALAGDGDAPRRLREVLAEARAVHEGFVIALGAWALVVIEAREPGCAGWRAAVEEAEPWMAGVGFRWGAAWARAAAAVHLLAEGDLDGADEAARAAAVTVGGSRRAELARGPVELARARVDLARGNPLAAEESVHRALAALHPAGLELQTVEALEVLAALSIELGGHAEAARLLAGATAVRRTLGFPRSGAESASAAGIEDVLAAAPDAEIVEAARADGGRMTLPDLIAYASRGRGPRRRPATGWDSLTPTEREVVNLVARGLPNRQIATTLFVSAETVKTHVSNALAKLGVANRTELAALAIRRG